MNQIATIQAQDYEYGVSSKSYYFEYHRDKEILILTPTPTLSELLSFYPNDYHGYDITERGFISLLYKILFKIRCNHYFKYISSEASILDVGCAEAEYFDDLKSRNPKAKITGLEFNHHIAEKGRNKGRDIRTTTLDEFKNEIKYDLIIMSNLIEHVIDPEKELLCAKNMLKENGMIFIETPNINSWDFQLMRHYWGGLHTPRHTFLYSNKSLVNLLDKLGFNVLKMNYGIGTDHWALSIQNFLQSHARFKVKLRKGRAWYFPLLLLVFLPLAVVQKILKKSGSISCFSKLKN